MGLGKTIQTICAIASSVVEQRKHFGLPVLREEWSSLNETKVEGIFPNLVICPTTVVGHWCDELDKFSGHVLQTLPYIGNPSERARY